MKKIFTKVYCVVTIDLGDPVDSSVHVQMYDEPLFTSQIIGEWWYYKDKYNDGLWYYDFSYKPSVSEVIKVLMPKLKELGFE